MSRYGNGVVAALEARALLEARGDFAGRVHVIDCPYLSAVPTGLRTAVQEGGFGAVLFADVCKKGVGAPLDAHAVSMHSDLALPPTWSICHAARAYNPLGNEVTFLNADHIAEQSVGLLERIDSAVK